MRHDCDNKSGNEIVRTPIVATEIEFWGALGEYRIPSDALRRVFAEIRAAAQWKKRPELGRLTAREREILALFAQGLSYAKIAEIRGNQPLTIRNAIYGIQDKLNIETKQELVVWAVRNGLLDE